MAAEEGGDAVREGVVKLLWLNHIKTLKINDIRRKTPFFHA